MELAARAPGTPRRRAPLDHRKSAPAFQLTPLWEHVVRRHAIPEDLDMDHLFLELRERLRDPEWEVRQHALRVLADLVPVMGPALDFRLIPLVNYIINNLGHTAPAVRKAALDVLKIYFVTCKVPQDVIKLLLNRCEYRKTDVGEEDFENNVITGIILSLPSLVNIMYKKQEFSSSVVLKILQTLGVKLFWPSHQDVALRALLKIQNIFGKVDFVNYMSKLESRILDKYRVLCDIHHVNGYIELNEAANKSDSYANNNKVRINHSMEGDENDTNGTEDSNDDMQTTLELGDMNNNNDADDLPVTGKIIMETEITFDSNTAIRMTVLESNPLEVHQDSKSMTDSESDSVDYTNYRKSLMKVFSDSDSEDLPALPAQKRVRFGGQVIKLRTPDSDNLMASDEDKKRANTNGKIQNVTSGKKSDARIPVNSNKFKTDAPSNSKKSNIPLPKTTKKYSNLPRYGNKTTTESTKKRPVNLLKQKSKSLNELYDYFRTKNKPNRMDEITATHISVSPKKEFNSFQAFVISNDLAQEDKIPSPLPVHREVEVLHNLQRSPSISPKRSKEKIYISDEDFSLTIIQSSSKIVSDPEPSYYDDDESEESKVIQEKYEWENLNIVSNDIVEQLHNTDNWISVVKALDRLHRLLLNSETVRRLEVGGGLPSLAAHIGLLGARARGARAPAAGVLGAIVRSARRPRALLPVLLPRLRAPALSHALLARLPLREIVACILEPHGDAIDKDADPHDPAESLAALGAAAGPAALLAALAHHAPHQLLLYDKVRGMLYEKGGGAERASEQSRSHRILTLPPITKSRLPRPRARSTPPPSRRVRRLRPLTESASAPTQLPVLRPHRTKREVFLRMEYNINGNKADELNAITYDDLDSHITILPDINGTVQISNGILSAVETRTESLHSFEEKSASYKDDEPSPGVRTSGRSASTTVGIDREDSFTSDRPTSDHEADNEPEPPAPDASETVVEPEHLDSALSETDDTAEGEDPPRSADENASSMRDEPHGEPEPERSVSRSSSSFRCVPDDESIDLPERSPSVRSKPVSTGSRASSFISLGAVSTLTAIGAEPPDLNPSRIGSSRSEPTKSDAASGASTSSVSLHSSPGLRPSSRDLTPNVSPKTSPKLTPESDTIKPPTRPASRLDVARCVSQLESDDWEKVITGLRDVERAAVSGVASGSAAWRPAARAVARHVRSLRSQVARAACRALGTLFEAQGRWLEAEADEAAVPLFDRTADTNRFIRADAESALARLSAGVSVARALSVLVARGSAHRAGAARGASARLLATTCARAGAARVLAAPLELRMRVLRAAADLLVDAGPDTRAHAKRLFVVLAEDPKFYIILKDSIPPSKYKNIEKVINKLRAGG